jgi:N-acetylmuramoyl-L-alanine amidase
MSRKLTSRRPNRRKADRSLAKVLPLAALLIASGALVSAFWRQASPDVFAGPPRPAVEATAPDVDDPPNTFGMGQPITSAKPGDPPGYTRVPAPKVEGGARRIGIQVGHWMTDNVPSELRRLEVQTGTSWDGITETSVNLDIATRIASLLRGHGYVVDIIPTTVPAGYLADAFVALHMDGDGTGENSGYKLAHGSRRGPYEQQLLNAIKDEYGAATGLRWDPEHISANMRGYYAFSWQRYRSATSPFTPSVVLEMGFLSSDDDRALLMEQPDLVARAIGSGIERFLSEVPSTELFGKDLLLPPSRSAFPTPSRSPSPVP